MSVIEIFHETACLNILLTMFWRWCFLWSSKRIQSCPLAARLLAFHGYAKQRWELGQLKIQLTSLSRDSQQFLLYRGLCSCSNHPIHPMDEGGVH